MESSWIFTNFVTSHSRNAGLLVADPLWWSLFIICLTGSSPSYANPWNCSSFPLNRVLGQVLQEISGPYVPSVLYSLHLFEKNKNVNGKYPCVLETFTCTKTTKHNQIGIDWRAIKPKVCGPPFSSYTDCLTSQLRPLRLRRAAVLWWLSFRWWGE